MVSGIFKKINIDNTRDFQFFLRMEGMVGNSTGRVLSNKGPDVLLVMVVAAFSKWQRFVLLLLYFCLP